MFNPEMFRTGFCLLLTCALLLLIPCPELQARDPELPHVIASASEYSYPPFCIVDENNRADGFSVELLRSALAAVGHDVSFRVGSWDEVRNSLIEGNVQVLPLVGRTPEREALFDFTVSYMTMRGTIIVRDNEDQIHSLKDLKGRQIAVMSGDNAEEFVRRQNLDAEIRTTASFEDALLELSQGRHDAVIMQKLLYIQLKKQLEITNLETAGPPLKDFVQSFCFAVPKGEAKLLGILNEGLALVVADGTFQQLRNKWFTPLEETLRSHIVVGGDFNYPPYEFLDENGQPAGYNVELTRAIADYLGISVTFRLASWEKTRERLLNQEIDVVQGMFYSPERDKVFSFTDDHTLISHVAVVRSGTEIPAALAELAGKTIIVISGDIMHDLVLKAGLSEHLLLAESQQEALHLLSEGRGDCALLARLPAVYWIKKNNLANLKVGEKSLVSSEYCYAGHGDNEDLIERFSAALTDLKAMGTYRTIHKKWLGIYEDRGVTPLRVFKYFLWITIPVFLLFVVSLIWSQVLKKQVRNRTTELEAEIAVRKQAEKELQTSEEKTRLIINSTAEAIYGLDQEGHCTFCNQSCLDLLGYRSERDLLGRNMHDLIHHTTKSGEPNPIHDCKNYKTFETGEKSNVDGDLLWRADGTAFPAEYWSHPILKNGTVIGAVVTFIDITRRRQMEEELAETRNILQTAMDQSPAGIMLVSAPDGKLQYINNAGRQLCGKCDQTDADGTVGDRYVTDWQLFDLDGRPLNAEERPLLRAIRYGETCSGEALFRGEGMEDRIVLGNTAPIINQAGQIKAAIGVFTDITARKQAEQKHLELESQLYQAQKTESIGRLAGGVAHEYNNMLSVIIGHAELARMKTELSDSLDDDLEQILVAAKRSRDITRQLLTFASKQIFEPKVLDLNASIENILKMLRHLLGENIALEWRPQKGLWPIEIDPSQFDQILANLCVNAREAIADVGRIIIETDRVRLDQTDCDEQPGFMPGDFVVLSVRDDGRGMNREIQDKIFEPFFTTKGTGQGPGLGLPTVYGIVKQSGGFIDVHSEPDKGTTFKIYLPRHTDPMAVKQATAGSKALNDQGMTVLVVEDEASILKLIATILDGFGHKVLAANSPAQALALAEAHEGEIPLLITDVMMPEMNGRELAGRLHRIYPDIKCLFMSGYTADVMADDGELDKETHFIHKPFTRDELDLQIRKIFTPEA